MKKLNLSRRDFLRMASAAAAATASGAIPILGQDADPLPLPEGLVRP